MFTKYMPLVAIIATCFLTGCQKNQPQVSENKNSDPITSVSTAINASRSFEFVYGAAIKDAPKGAKVRVWFPIAQTNAQQTVTQSHSDVPSELKINRDEKYDNQIGYFEHVSDGDSAVNFSMKFDVERKEAIVDEAAKELSAEQRELFLSSNALVPTDGKPQDVFKSTELPK